MIDGTLSASTTQSTSTAASAISAEVAPAPSPTIARQETSGETTLATAWRTLLMWCCVLLLVRFGPASLVRLYSAAIDKEATKRLQTLKFQVDLNAATAAELQTLEGIGPALAERIVQNREHQGPFQSLADLRRVAGFGEKRVEQLAPYIVIELSP